MARRGKPLMLNGLAREKDAAASGRTGYAAFAALWHGMSLFK
jgi:hypothetical protein